jgi:hypothetical protein
VEPTRDPSTTNGRSHLMRFVSQCARFFSHIFRKTPFVPDSAVQIGDYNDSIAPDSLRA